MSYKIMHKDSNRHMLFASGFYSLERAQKWVEAFNPQMYVDKTLKREDLVILEESFAKAKGGAI